MSLCTADGPSGAACTCKFVLPTPSCEIGRCLTLRMLCDPPSTGCETIVHGQGSSTCTMRKTQRHTVRCYAFLVGAAVDAFFDPDIRRSFEECITDVTEAIACPMTTLRLGFGVVGVASAGVGAGVEEAVWRRMKATHSSTQMPSPSSVGQSQ